MAHKVLVFDYNPGRIDLVKEIIRSKYNKFDLHGLRIGSPEEPLNLRILDDFTQHEYDLIIGVNDGKPHGKECIKKYKDSKKNGKVILYTNQAIIPVSDFQDYKRSDKMIEIQAATGESDRMSILNAVEDVLNHPSVNYWTSPFKTKEFWLSLLAFATALTVLATAVIRFLGPTVP
jgi:hypothetical protein